MKKILTALAAAALIGCSALTAPAASAYAPPVSGPMVARQPAKCHLPESVRPAGCRLPVKCHLPIAVRPKICLRLIKVIRVSPIEVGRPRPRTP